MFAETEVLSVAEMKNRDRVAAYRAKVRSDVVSFSVDAGLNMAALVRALNVAGFVFVNRDGETVLTTCEMFKRQAG